jgi:phospholipid/cholesterol/gamma-HCH transport system substrate-binding protein
MKQSRAIELGTGLFVLLGFAALFFLVTQISSRGAGFGDSGYRLTAKPSSTNSPVPSSMALLCFIANLRRHGGFHRNTAVSM